VVGRPLLELTLADPSGPVLVGGRVVYQVTIRNRGTGPAGKVEVAVTLTGGLSPVRGTGPGQTAATAADGGVTFQPLDELPPGAAATFTLDADATSPGDARVTARVSAKELAAPLQEEQATRVRRR